MAKKTKKEMVQLISRPKTSDFDRVAKMIDGLERVGLEASNPEKIVDISNLSKEQWLQYRRQGFGGSDAGTVMGVNTFNDIDNLYLDKKGMMIHPKDTNYKDQARLDAGHQMEPVIANIFQAMTGYHVFTDTWMYRHSEYDFMLADVDFMAVDLQGLQVGVECKYINPDDLKMKWASGIVGQGAKIGNLSYYVQCCHYMAVLNLDRWFLCVWGGNNADDICIIRIDRDYDYERELIEKEMEAWENIQNNIRPQLQYKTANAMKKLETTLKKNPETKPDLVKLGKDNDFINDIIIPYSDIEGQISELNEQIKALKEQKNVFEEKICEFLNQNGYERVAMEYNDEDIILCEIKQRKSSSFGYEGLKAADPETYEYLEENGFIKKSVSKSLKVSLKNKKYIM